MARTFLRIIRTKFVLYISLAIIGFSVLQPAIALAVDVPFFSGNDILFYNPDDCAVSSSGTNSQTIVAVIGNDNAEKIFNFLTTTNFAATGGKPFNAVQAAGALGNFQQESAINPAAVEPNGNGHGLAQWSFERWTQLQSLASSQNKDWTDLSLQLLMIQNELNNQSGFSAEGSRLASYSNGEFAGVTDPARASYIFQVSYERAGDPQQANRDSAAKAYYEKFKDKAPNAAGASTASSSTNGGCARGAATGDFSNDAQFTFYNQCDSPWGPTVPPTGTVCHNACGPTSTAMAIKNMTGQGVTPGDTTSWVTQNNLWISDGGGTSFDTNVQLAGHWGVKATTISKNQAQDINYIRSILSASGMVMVAGNGPRPYYGSAAHFILIRAITADGQIKIANPAPTGPDDNTRLWNAGDIINSNTFGGVAFTK